MNQILKQNGNVESMRERTSVDTVVRGERKWQDIRPSGGSV